MGKKIALFALSLLFTGLLTGDFVQAIAMDSGQPADEAAFLQIKKEDGSFVSSQGELQVQLDSDWNVVTQENMLTPNTAFALEKDNTQWFIQLFYESSTLSQEMTPLLLEVFVSTVRKTYPAGTPQFFGSPYSITLDGLGGVEAWLVDEDIKVVGSDVYIKNIAFIYNGYNYFGCFMWVKELDAIARPWMEEAIQSLSIPADAV